MAGVYEFICQHHVRALVEVANESDSTRLFIDDLQLSNFKTVVASVLAGGLSNLQYLRADHNCFCGPLPELSCLQSLVRLNLNDNPLRTLTDGVGRLSELRELWLNGTGLEELPPTIGSLRQLQILSARGNRIRSVPEELVALTNLRWLIVDDNEISQLPRGFCKLENLVHCNFNKNKISSLCPLAVSIESLQFFYIADNGIVEISSSLLENARQVKTVDLRNNPLSLTSIQECEEYPNVVIDGESEDDYDELEDEEDIDDESEDEDCNWAETPNSTDTSDSSEDEDEHGAVIELIYKITRFIVSAGC